MTFLDRLERHLGRFAIPHLIRYIVGFNALVYILITTNPGYGNMLTLDRGAILSGEVWRLISWIFLPNTETPLFIIFFLLFTWWVGDLLEGFWGTFRLNAYYLLGIILCTASALFFGVSGGNILLNLSLFLAVATLAPNLEILLFLVIPMKIKWVAVISLIFPVMTLLFGSLADKMMVIMCLGNYLLFFGPHFIRERSQRQRVATRRTRFEAAKDTSESLHHCETCGITEMTNPEADFRVAENGHEYCSVHLPGAKEAGRS